MTAPTLRERARKARYALEEKLVLESSMLEGGVIQRMAVGVERAYISGSLDAMRECAKLVCWQCGRGIAVARADEQEWCHLYANDPGCVPCQASDIHTLIASAREAEARKGEGSDG